MKRKSFFLLFPLILAFAIFVYLVSRARSNETVAAIGKQGNVIMIVVDALRADHLSCYGYEQHTSPNIDRIAKQGLLLENLFVPLPMTQPSLASLLTSLYPETHGIKLNGKALSPLATSLPEILLDNGWQTAAIVGAYNMDSIFGLDQGFQLYNDFLNSKAQSQTAELGKRQKWERSAQEVNRLAFQWLQDVGKRGKFFLMLHYFEPHQPYQPPPPFHTAYGQGTTQQKRKTALYDGEVSFVDQQIGQLLAKLEELKLIDKTLLVLTADHGESLGEHDWEGHIWRLYDEAVRVPCILTGPGISPGQRSKVLLQNIDLAPTLLEYLGLPENSQFQGHSFLATITGSKKIRDYVFLEKGAEPKTSTGFSGWKKFPFAQWAIRSDSEKFIWSADGNHEFYDLVKDPQELKNLFASENERAMNLYRIGLKYKSNLRPRNLAVSPAQGRENAEVDEGLKALGYVN